jgi:formate hydrogenlyase subunit 6/NADH:ubiquinone oxidoreductase subunit I
MTKKLVLHFGEDLVNDAITAQVILETKVLVNILRANVQETGGYFLVEIPDEDCERVKKAFEAQGVRVERGKMIEKINEKCIDCGACYAICPSSAIEVTPDYTIQFKYENCIGCLNCIDTCPVGAIILQK